MEAFDEFGVGGGEFEVLELVAGLDAGFFVGGAFLGQSRKGVLLFWCEVFDDRFHGLVLVGVKFQSRKS